MFGLFNSKRKSRKSENQLIDLNGNNISEGDIVLSHRYELGNCNVVSGSNGLEYESIESKKRVNWTLMIDAATERQKVEKLDQV